MHPLALAASASSARPVTGLLPAWLDPNEFLRDPALAPWLVLIVCAFLFAETGLLVGFFLPGDSLLFTAGLLTATGIIQVNIAILAGAAFLAAFGGDQTGYLLGRKAGPAVFKRPGSRFLRSEYADKAHNFFLKYGRRSVVLARFVPIVRTFLPVTAGVGRMSYRAFLAYNAVGAMLWGVGVTFLGFWLGRYAWIGANIDLIFVVIVLVSFVPVGVELLKNRRQNRSR
ncbi:membrane-associated protein [Pseudarthrobacter defluvii]|uniref:VTT domain-containing protein n=1 Tax=Pseudarthrobacter defluvii TaxID=410837 RepID=UPI00277EAE82|nr:VTT domain-containing protein [Pseudarthrobacter defluvii]MDQ0767997.1 membrane-associated protein [Pseudarthrobacter defluvii]